MSSPLRPTFRGEDGRTIAVVGEILAQPKVGFAGYESNWYWIVNQLFSEL